MVEYNSLNIFPNLSDQQQFRPAKINEIKKYFVAEIKERLLISKRLSKGIDFFTIVIIL